MYTYSLSTYRGASKQVEDLYADSGVLFCMYYEHSVDHLCVDTMKDHLKSKKHCQRKVFKLAEADASRPSTSNKVL